MTSALVAARDGFAARNPEQPFQHGGRHWGVIDTGGTHPALLLLPGTLGRADVFFHQIEALSPRLRVIAVSHPSSGSLEDWTADLVALLDQRGVGAAAVLGSSLGGYMAQILAGHHPGRVTHLFAANTLAGTAGLTNRPPYALDLEATPIDELRAGFEAGLAARAASHPAEAGTIDLLRAEIAGRIPEPELRARLSVLKNAPELPACPLPPERITVIDAEDEPLLPADWRAAVRARLSPGAAFAFAHGGHFP
ncbi:MAG: alpha/beta hydrolase [Rhodobacteraceae bacterium]|nr:alpha/beta hydrolase [Paracoccaceae bacterium]